MWWGWERTLLDRARGLERQAWEQREDDGAGVFDLHTRRRMARKEVSCCAAREREAWQVMRERWREDTEGQAGVAGASASTQKRTGKCSEVGQASSRAHVKGSLLMQNRKENAGKIGIHRGVAAVMVY